MNHWFPGSRMCALRGERVGLAVYASQGRTMSLFMGAPTLLCSPGLKQPEGPLSAQDNATLSWVAWQHNGHVHVAVSDLTLAQLKERARQCQASL
jgi:hypothetical protein